MAGSAEAADIQPYRRLPIDDFLGIEFLETTKDLVTARMKVTDRNRQPDHQLHGGACLCQSGL
jgi:acyl-coenzyme A thioesterase PaaI-like protein